MSDDQSDADEPGKAPYDQLDIEEDDDKEDAGSPVDESDGSSHLTASDDETSWITWFVSLRGNDFFCEIDEDYIEDDFNLTGLQSLVPYYLFALDFILDVDIPADSLTEDQQEIVEIAAEVLYGLIHARYILTGRGMISMFNKYQDAEFGTCPRVSCEGQHCLPVGMSDQQRSYPVNVYCPKCQELYYPRSTKQAGLDGAYFGTTFAHMFLLTYPDLIPRKTHSSSAANSDKYIPKIYGFRIHQESSYYKLREPELLIEGGINTELETVEDRFRIGEEEEVQGNVEEGRELEENFFEREDGTEVSQIP